MSDIRAGKAFVETFLKDKVSGGLERVEKRLTRFASSTQAIGRRLFGSGLSLAAPLAAASTLFAKHGDRIAKMSARLGFSVESLSQLDFATSQAGTSLEVFETGFRRLQAVIGDDFARTDIFHQYGVDIGRLQGMHPEQQFESVADSIRQIEDPTKRAAAAYRLFGRAGTQLLPLMKDGAEGIREYKKEADNLGLTLSAEDAVQAEKLTDAWDALAKTAKQGAVQIGAAMAPALSDLFRQLTVAIRGGVDFIRNNRAIVTSVGLAAGGLLGAGAALLTLGTSAHLAAFGVGGLRKMLLATAAPLKLLSRGGVAASAGMLKLFSVLRAMIALPFGLAIAGIKAIASGGLASSLAAAGAAFVGALSPFLLMIGGGALLGGAIATAVGGIGSLQASFETLRDKAIGVWQSVAASAGQAWSGIKAAATKSFGAIVQRIGSGDLQGAFRIAVLGMKAMWAETVAAFAPQWAAFTTAFSRLWGDSVALVSNLWQGFTSMFSGAAEFLTSAWNSAVTFITGNTGADGVETTWNDVSASVAQMWNWLVFRAENAWNAIKKAAMDAADGIRKSWGNAVGWIAEKIVEIPGVATLLGVEAYDLKKEANAMTDQRNDAIDTRVAERDKEFQVTEDTQAALEHDIGRNIDQERERRNEEDKATREQAIEDAKKAREDARKKLNDEKSPSLVAPDTINGRSLSELKAELEAGQQRAAAGSAATLRSGEIQSRILQAMRGNDTKKEQEKTNEKLDDLIGKQDEVMDTIEESISFEVIA